MKITLSNGEVVETLLDHNVLGERHEDKVIEGTAALVDWLVELEEGTGEDIKLDPVALRCQFGLYTHSEAEETWCIDTSDAESPEQLKQMIEDYLNDHTIVITVDSNNLIIGDF